MRSGRILKYSAYSAPDSGAVKRRRGLQEQLQELAK